MKKLLLTIGLLIGLLALNVFPTVKWGDHWINPRLFDGTALEATYTPSVLKSRTSQSVSVTSGNLTGTNTIAAVNVSSTSLEYGGLFIDTGGSANGFTYLELTNATTVTATRGNSGSGNVFIRFTLMEYLPQFVNSIQRFPMACTSGITNHTITSVNTLKSVTTLLGSETADNASGNSSNWFGLVVLTGSPTSTNVSCTMGGASGVTASVQVFEWK